MSDIDKHLQWKIIFLVLTSTFPHTQWDNTTINMGNTECPIFTPFVSQLECFLFIIWIDSQIQLHQLLWRSLFCSVTASNISCVCVRAHLLSPIAAGANMGLQPRRKKKNAHQRPSSSLYCTMDFPQSANIFRLTAVWFGGGRHPMDMNGKRRQWMETGLSMELP